MSAFFKNSIGFFAEWLVFLLLAMAATQPLTGSWKSAIPQGTESASTVPLFNLWTLGWNISRAENGLRDYWDAPIFFPTPDAFAFSEPQPTMMLMAPVIWLGGTLAMAYNLYLWLGLSLTGVATSRLVLRLTGSWLAAWSGGAMMLMLPFVHWQLGVLQLVPLFGVIWTISALAKFGEDPSIRHSLLLGTAFALTYFLCNYYGLFLSVLLILSGLWLLGRNVWNWRAWGKLFPGVAWCLLLTGPMILHQRNVSQEHDWTRPPELIQQQSAKWGDFTATPWPQLLPIPQFVKETRSGWTLSPGYLKMGVAVLGLIWGLYSPPLRRMALFLGMFIILSYLLAMGPNLHWQGWVPYDGLRQYYPGLKMARNVFRFVVFAQIGIALLAALGLAGVGNVILGTWRHSEGSPRATATVWEALFPRRLVVLTGLSFLVVIEVWPSPQNLFPLPNYANERGWLTWLEENTAPDDPLACLPFPNGGNAEAYFGTTVWMYYALDHRHPILNGYSGFFPEPFLELKAAMANFPDSKSLHLLEEHGTRYCIVFRGSVARSQIEQDPLAAQSLHWRFGDDRAEIDIYEFQW